MAKIFVSSTYLDLQDFRKQVELVIRQMGHEDVAMEYYVAEDQRPLERCLRDVAACDLYVGIFAWRYGWIPKKDNPNNLSITELECREATKAGKPRLIFLLSDEAPWPPKFIDEDREIIKRLRSELGEERLCVFFDSPDSLGKAVTQAIHKWEKDAKKGSSDTVILEFEQAYREVLRERHQFLTLESLTPPHEEEYLQVRLRSVFVEQDVREELPPIELPKELWDMLVHQTDVHPSDLPEGITLDEIRYARERYYAGKPRPVLDVLADPHYRHIVILGDPGSGKSTLARYIALSLMEPSGNEKLRNAFKGYLPFLVELRTYAGLCADAKCDTFLGFLEYLGKTDGSHLTKNVVQEYLKDGRAIVIFDGLDEILEQVDRERITEQIVGFTLDFPKTHVVVTSRIIGYRSRILRDAGFVHFTLQDLDDPQIRRFVNDWYGLALDGRPDDAQERRERLLRALGVSRSIRQLAGNPMLLTIMAIIGKHQELPRERWKLYEHAASVLIQHWDINKHLRDQLLDVDFIGEDEKKELLRRIAYRMRAESKGPAANYIGREQLQSEFEDYLTERWKQPSERATTIARAMMDQFRERNFVLSLYGANLYGFVHRAFLEYFCATAFVQRFEKTRELTLEQLKRDVYMMHWADENWNEVLRLICAMIDERFSGELIDHMTCLAHTPWTMGTTSRTAVLLPPSIVLAVQCLGEIKNINSVGESSKRLLLAICRLFDTPVPLVYRYHVVLNQRVVLPALEIGERWPERAVLADWLRKRSTKPMAYVYADFFGNLVGSLGSGLGEVHDAVLEYARHNDKDYRVLALPTLAIGWRDDPETLRILYDRVISDPDERVRGEACKVLAEHFSHDPGTLETLQDRAVNDAHQWVRIRACDALTQYFSDEPATRTILCQQAINDKDEELRWRAAWALAEEWSHDHDVMLLLRSQVLNDGCPSVRMTALTMLAENFRDDPETLPLVRDRIINDTDESVRATGLCSLAESFHEDSKTQSILLSHATAPAKLVRSAALRSLAKHFSHDSKTSRLLRYAAVNDKEETVRHDSLHALADYLTGDRQTFQLLNDRAINDVGEEIRMCACRRLAKYFRDDPMSAQILRNRAVEDAKAAVRVVALRLLVERFRDDKETLSLMRDRAINDESPACGDRPLSYGHHVREFAIYSLGTFWPFDPCTLEILRDRVMNDQTEWLRETAMMWLKLLDTSAV